MIRFLENSIFNASGISCLKLCYDVESPTVKHMSAYIYFTFSTKFVIKMVMSVDQYVVQASNSDTAMTLKALKTRRKQSDRDTNMPLYN